MGLFSSPKAPDYAAAAREQGVANEKVNTAQTFANRANQYTPFGSEEWTAGQGIDPATGQPVTTWSSNTTLTPRLQESLDSQIGAQLERSRLGEEVTGRLRNDFSTPIDWSGAQDFGEVPGKNYAMPLGSLVNAERLNATGDQVDPRYTESRSGQVQPGQISGTGADVNSRYVSGMGDQIQDPNSFRQRGEDAAYSQAMSRLNPAFAEESRALEVKLRNQGLNPEDAAWQASMGTTGRSQTDARMQAIWGASAAGREESALNYGQALSRNQNAFGQNATAASQNYGQDLSRNQNTFNQNAAASNQNFGQNLAANQNAFGQDATANAQNFGQNLAANQNAFGQNVTAAGQNYGQDLSRNQNTFNQNAAASNQNFGQNLAVNQNDFSQDATANAQNFGQDLSRNQNAFGQNQAATNQNFGQNMAVNQNTFGQSMATIQENNNQNYRSAEYANTLRQQQRAEMMQQRGFALNEANALLSGQQVGMPQMPTYNTAGRAEAAPTYQATVDQGNFEQGNQQSMWGGLGDLAGAGMQAYGTYKASDRRLKTNIRRIGTVKGYPWYAYDYIWGEASQGVMADEVPVEFTADIGGGFKGVHYAALLGT